MLLRLPAIEPAGPPPGAAADPHRPPAADEPRMLTRIRALLAKAEATGFPEEAEALTTKAQELMARHTIDEALLAARTHSRETPGACRIGVEPPYEGAKAVLLDAVASANRCRAVWNEDLGFSTVVGFEPDLDAVELLFTSLLVQGTTAMTRSEAGQRAGGRKRTKTFSGWGTRNGSAAGSPPTRTGSRRRRTPARTGAAGCFPCSPPGTSRSPTPPSGCSRGPRPPGCAGSVTWTAGTTAPRPPTGPACAAPAAHGGDPTAKSWRRSGLSHFADRVGA